MIEVLPSTILEGLKLIAQWAWAMILVIIKTAKSAWPIALVVLFIFLIKIFWRKR